MAFRYSPVRNWPHHRFNYFRLHNWTGYIALAVTFLHPLALLLNRSPKFRIPDLLYPVHSPQQPLENTIGAIALYSVALIVVTSYFRIQIGRRTWKAFHFTVYLGALALFWHALFTDPDLKGAPIDWFDGGKLFIEVCALVILVSSLLRWQHSRKENPPLVSLKSLERIPVHLGFFTAFAVIPIFTRRSKRLKFRAERV